MEEQNQQQGFNGATPPPVPPEVNNNCGCGQDQCGQPHNQPQGYNNGGQYQQQPYGQGQPQQSYNQGQPQYQQQYQQQPQQNIYVNNAERKSNSMGAAGMIMAIVALFVSWIPILSWIVWMLGLIFSIIGVFKEPRGMAIAGLVISLIGVIIQIVFIGALFSLAALSM